MTVLFPFKPKKERFLQFLKKAEKNIFHSNAEKGPLTPFQMHYNFLKISLNGFIKSVCFKWIIIFHAAVPPGTDRGFEKKANSTL